MRITIVLPAYYNFPIGGYHVHYTYANLLAQRGHDVTIIFPRSTTDLTDWRSRITQPLWSAKLRLRNRPLISTFAIDPRVRVLLLRDLSAGLLPDADVLIATAWQTAEALRRAPAAKGRKSYIVYDYEYWVTASPDMRARIGRTFDGSFRMIATSEVVESMIQSYGHRAAARIPCGLNFETFGVDRPIGERPSLSVGFPLRREPFKGAADAIAAAALLREEFSNQLVVRAFGSHAVNVPSWIERLHHPSDLELRRFYNEVAVFMLPSHFEGWGLTGVEAMACGTALVTTDNGGCRDYAFDGRTALVVPPKRPDLVAEAVTRLFRDRALLEHLATAGCDYVQQYRWATSVDALESLLRR